MFNIHDLIYIVYTHHDLVIFTLNILILILGLRFFNWRFFNCANQYIITSLIFSRLVYGSRCPKFTRAWCTYERKKSSFINPLFWLVKCLVLIHSTYLRTYIYVKQEKTFLPYVVLYYCEEKYSYKDMGHYGKIVNND